MEKVIRTICYFTKNPSTDTTKKLDEIKLALEKRGFKIQTTRICSPDIEKKLIENDLMWSAGTLPYEKILRKIQGPKMEDIYFNLDLTNTKIEDKHAKLLFEIIRSKPQETFNFTYTFNNSKSSPYFPSADFEQEGFSIGLQPTDLAENCTSLEEWLQKLKDTWSEVDLIFSKDDKYLGIDSSIAPLLEKSSSLIHFIKKISNSFSESVTTDIYTKITNFIKTENPKPIGLCGLMLPCLEDFELAKEYEKGNFSIERNIFLSLHSGIGIDTYPIGIDESLEKVKDILKLIQALSNKYKKSLSTRFVSDGTAKIGEKTDFKNQYLKDITIRKL